MSEEPLLHCYCFSVNYNLVTYVAFYIFLLFIFMCLECMYVCAPYVFSGHGDQKTPDTLRLGLQTVVRYHVGAGNQTPIL